jgi:hypothetical protein
MVIHAKVSTWNMGYKKTEILLSINSISISVQSPLVQWVRERHSHSLPVVAIGLIPYIYRHAAFPHRAAPERLPHIGGVTLSFFDSQTEVLTTKQSEAINVLCLHFPVVEA